MQNLAGHQQSTALCAIELQAAGITIILLPEPHGEPRSYIGGTLGSFTFRRAWVYWCVSGEMSKEHARSINTAKCDSEQKTKYSGGAQTWGDVIRVDGFAGGRDVTGAVDSWHIDTDEGLAHFAARLREFGYA